MLKRSEQRRRWYCGVLRKGKVAVLGFRRDNATFSKRRWAPQKGDRSPSVANKDFSQLNRRSFCGFFHPWLADFRKHGPTLVSKVGRLLTNDSSAKTSAGLRLKCTRSRCLSRFYSFPNVGCDVIDLRRAVGRLTSRIFQVFRFDGTFVRVFGERGSKNGQFTYPWDVAVNLLGVIAVTDTRNHRVQLFSFEGSFLSKYGFEGKPSCFEPWTLGLTKRCVGVRLVVAALPRCASFFSLSCICCRFEHKTIRWPFTEPDTDSESWHFNGFFLIAYHASYQ